MVNPCKPTKNIYPSNHHKWSQIGCINHTQTIGLVLWVLPNWLVYGKLLIFTKPPWYSPRCVLVHLMPHGHLDSGNPRGILTKSVGDTSGQYVLEMEPGWQPGNLETDRNSNSQTKFSFQWFCFMAATIWSKVKQTTRERLRKCHQIWPWHPGTAKTLGSGWKWVLQGLPLGSMVSHPFQLVTPW